MPDQKAEFARMIKYGRREEVAEYVRVLEKTAYTDDFVSFMDQMIREHHVSRKQVALRAGLSQDYTYKLLRGDKHTDERDYILAMCLAAGMTFAQTQHALSCYGMPLLSEADIRSHIIILALQDGLDMDRLNSMLENAGFLALRTSPDMPSSPIRRTAPDSHAPESAPSPLTFSEEEAETSPCGPSPLDIGCSGSLLARDGEGHAFRAAASFSPDGECFSVFRPEDWAALRSGGDPEEAVPLEVYPSLEDASASRFFPAFLYLDRITDRKMLEALRAADDTRSFGSRVGCHIAGGHLELYMEAFNPHEPQKREYYQIREREGGACRFTASHESYFLRMELGEDIYAALCGEKRPMEFFVDTQDMASHGPRCTAIFSSMLRHMHAWAASSEGMFPLPDEVLEREAIQDLMDRASQEEAQDPEAARATLGKLLDTLGPEPPDRHLGFRTCACMRLAGLAVRRGDEEEAMSFWRSALAMKDRLIACDAPGKTGALSMLVHACAQLLRREHGSRVLIDTAVDLMEHHGACAEDWPMRFEIYAALAMALETEDLEASIRVYRQILAMARDHRLDQVPYCAIAVSSVYNNLGWVLWNLAGSEEAIVFYGRSIDLMEGYLAAGSPPRKEVLPNLEHTSKALHALYTSSGRRREAEALERRMAEYGIHLS